jgi:hypothetical protein
MLPFTPEGVLLQEGDVRREPPFVLALCASTPYRNGQKALDSVAHRSSLPLAAAGSWHFWGCANGLLLAHSGLLQWPGGSVASKGQAGPWHRDGAMIGGLAVLHKQFQKAGSAFWQTRRA